MYACPKDTAIKRLHVDATQASRELTLADALAEKVYNHIVPVLDAGADAETGTFYIVMPRCKQSLDDHLRERGGTLPLTEAIKVLRDITSGLIEVGSIVHRDLKPGNVLLHSDHWKIADFGIARFVEDTTSLNTMKECLTPPFAAPEQWRNDRASNATDIYALGCIAHALLTGIPPFQGKDLADWQRLHLSAEPKSLPDQLPGKLRSLISYMLRKPPEVRPTAQRILSALHGLAEDESGVAPAFQKLSHIDAQISLEIAQREAAQHARELQKQETMRIEKESERSITEIRDALFKTIKLQASNASAAKWELSLGGATLTFHPPPIAKHLGTFAQVGSWKVYNSTQITISQTKEPRYIWGASLWFGSEGNSGELRGR